jgi:hypothetical protein
MKKQFQNQFKRTRGTLGVALISLLISLSGCGKESFTPTPLTNPETAPPGIVSIPPNVDILVFVDSSGSMGQIIGEFESQVSTFLKQLETKGWNFHFAVAPLESYRAIQQVAGSHYDSNSGANWVKPYPGATPFDSGTIVSSFFRTPDSFSDYVTINNISNTSLGQENGFPNMLKVIREGTEGSGLFRKDQNGNLGKVRIIAIGNGAETSYNFCTSQSSSSRKPCEVYGRPACTMDEFLRGVQNCSSQKISLDYYTSQMKSVSADLKLYSVFSPKDTPTCRGSGAYAGTRYTEMAKRLNGKDYDVCASSISTILDEISSDLQVEKIALKTKYIFIDQDANPDSIVVTRYEGGDKSKASIIPAAQGGDNGWVYEGLKTEEVDVTYSPMNGAVVSRGKGYAILLKGSAQLNGNDQASVEFTQAGAKPAQTE